MRSVDLVIATVKSKVYTIERSLNLPKFDNIIIVEGVIGLGIAHNECFRRSNSDLAILAADDIVIDPEVWKYALSVKPGEFAMLDTGDFGITGVFAIYLKDFWRVGGFDEKLKFGGVDRDFFCRALLAGMKFKKIPLRLVKHISHETRSSTIYKSFNVMKDTVSFIKKYFIYFPKEVFVHDFLNRFRRGQFRTILLELIFFYKDTLFG